MQLDFPEPVYPKFEQQIEDLYLFAKLTKVTHGHFEWTNTLPSVLALHYTPVEFEGPIVPKGHPFVCLTSVITRDSHRLKDALGDLRQLQSVYLVPIRPSDLVVQPKFARFTALYSPARRIWEIRTLKPIPPSEYVKLHYPDFEPL